MKKAMPHPHMSVFREITATLPRKERLIPVIQWHPGFESGIELRLRRHRSKLQYRHELPLSKKPIILDTLVIIKEDGYDVDEDVGAIFRKYNIFEYKNPDDALSIDEYYALITYMARYKSETGNTNEIKADQITGTMIRQRYPEKMFGEVRRLGGMVERRFPGICYITGLIHMPTQVIVQRELNGPENAVLRILTRTANESDVRTFVQETRRLTGKEDKNNADAVYQVSVSANRELYAELIRSDPVMCTALRELLKDEIQADIIDGEKRGEIQKAKAIALNMKAIAGMNDPAYVARIVGVTTELVEQWFAEAK